MKLALLVLAMAFVSSCFSGRAESPGSRTGGEGQGAGKNGGETGTPAERQSPAETLRRLGFHVFDEPIPLPDRSFASLDGTPQRLGALSGSVTLLNFWATWCPPCRKEMPSIERLKKAMDGENFRIVAISTGEDAKTVRAFIKREGYTFPIYLDESGALGSEFASQGIPTTYVVDARGNIIAGAVGAREYDDPALVAAFKELSR